MHHFPLIFSLLLLLFLTLLAPVLSAALLIPPSPSPSNVSLSIPALDSPTYCKTLEPHWDSDDSYLELADCTAALHRFYAVQVTPYQRSEFEFLAPGANPRFRRWPDIAVTPRKYTIGTCVLAIAMINFYPEGVLPERGDGPFLDNDVARYLTVWSSFHDIIFKCQAPGWSVVGEGQHIATLVFGAGSDMNRRTPSGTFFTGAARAARDE
ncbi:MAG: hypothetical protein Q9185_005213 [Variospora sp. 1 TL-2023]